MFGECHAHLYLDGIDFRKARETHKKGPDLSVIRKELKAYQQAGVHFLRDGGDPYGVSELAASVAPEYEIDYRTPVFAIHKEGQYGGIVGKSFRTLSDVRKLISEIRLRGGDFIKIMTTGIMDFKTPDGITGEPLNREEIRMLCGEAHDAGFRVMSHTNGPASVILAAEEGVDSIEHGNFQNEESLSCLAELDVVYVPTTVTVRNLMGLSLFDPSVLEQIWKGIVKNIRKAKALGVQIALGSDAGAKGVLHGQGVLDEYETLSEILSEEWGSQDDWFRKGEERIRTFCRS